MTADLGAARELFGEIGYLLEGRREVAELLGLAADVRESTILAGLVNRARNEALVDIIGAADDVMTAYVEG